MNYINKNTKVFASFSIAAGNNGCRTFNACFLYYNMDCIYKSFSINSIQNAVIAAKELGFKGFAVSTPFKKEILSLVDNLDIHVKTIGAANTVVNNDGYLTAYNTDFCAVRDYLKERDIRHLNIIGDGGLASAVKYACLSLKIKHQIINRDGWQSIQLLRKSNIMNCTPVESLRIHSSNNFIDAIPTTVTGIDLAKRQAAYQFEIYTGEKFPL